MGLWGPVLQSYCALIGHANFWQQRADLVPPKTEIFAALRGGTFGSRPDYFGSGGAWSTV
jgi:hypothetical protein